MAPSTPIQALVTTLILSLLTHPSSSIPTHRQPLHIIHRAKRDSAVSPNPSSTRFAPTQVAIRTLYLGSDDCKSRLTRSEVFLLGACHTYFIPIYESGEAGDKAATAPTLSTPTGKTGPRTVKVTTNKGTVTHTIYGLGGCVEGRGAVNATTANHKHLTQVSSPIGHCMTNDDPYLVNGVAWNTSFIWSIADFTYDFNQPSPVGGQIRYLLPKNRTPSQEKPTSCPKINLKGTISNSTVRAYAIGKCQKLADSWVTALDFDENSSNFTAPARTQWVKAIAISNETYVTRRFFDAKCIFPVAESDTIEKYGDCRVVNRKHKSPMLVVVGFKQAMPATTAATHPTASLQVAPFTPRAETAFPRPTHSSSSAQTTPSINGNVPSTAGDLATNLIGATTTAAKVATTTAWGFVAMETMPAPPQKP